MILVDAYVHIYDCFDLEKFFDSAYSNFQTEAKRLGHRDEFTGILLLAETLNDNWFHYVADYADGENLPEGKEIDNWSIHRTDENCSLKAQSGNSKELYLIAGRQIITAEKLEVLALMTIDHIKDDDQITEIIKRVIEIGGIPVIPWGFGKWMGRRGKLVKSLLRNTENLNFFLGDNANRPAFLPKPLQFKMAAKMGIAVLPGSDPFPFSSEFNRVGSFGFCLNGSISRNNPSRYLKKFLLDSNLKLQAFG